MAAATPSYFAHFPWSATGAGSIALSNETVLNVTYLGGGSHGSTFKITAPTSLRNCVLKVAHATGKVFTQERTILRHAKDLPNVVQLVEIPEELTTSTGHDILILEEAPGKPLHTRITLGTRISDVEVLRIIKGILIGLKGLRERNLHHLDLKPENILYDPSSGALTIVDLGIAETEADLTESCRIAPHTIAYGKQTYFYRDPLLMLGRIHEPDMWSVACIALELLGHRFRLVDLKKPLKIQAISPTSSLLIQLLSLLQSARCLEPPSTLLSEETSRRSIFPNGSKTSTSSAPIALPRQQRLHTKRLRPSAHFVAHHRLLAQQLPFTQQMQSPGDGFPISRSPKMDCSKYPPHPRTKWKLTTAMGTYLQAAELLKKALFSPLTGLQRNQSLPSLLAALHRNLPSLIRSEQPLKRCINQP